MSKESENFKSAMKKILSVSRKDVEAESERQKKTKKQAKSKPNKLQPQK